MTQTRLRGRDTSQIWTVGDEARAAELLAQEAHLNARGLKLEPYNKTELEFLFLKHKRYGQPEEEHENA